MIESCNLVFTSNYFYFLQQIGNGPFNWSMMPAELKPNWKRKFGMRDSANVAKDVNVEETLKALEQKEKITKTDNIKNEQEDENVRILVDFIFIK